MVKKFSIPCIFGGQTSPFTIYVGDPEDRHHPLHFQADWLQKVRGGQIPPEIMDSMQKLKDLANKNGVSFQELCVYAINSVNSKSADNDKQAEE